MREIAQGELAEMLTLVTRPTSTNLVNLVTRLEGIAAQVNKIEADALSRGFCEPTLAANLRTLQGEMSRVQRLLLSAARFYNGIASFRMSSTAGYERTGLLRAAASDARVLAQL